MHYKPFCDYNFTLLYYLDTDECLQSLTCHANAICDNTEGSYMCACDTGYSGDGFLCNGKKTRHKVSATPNELL